MKDAKYSVTYSQDTLDKIKGNAALVAEQVEVAYLYLGAYYHLTGSDPLACLDSAYECLSALYHLIHDDEEQQQ